MAIPAIPPTTPPTIAPTGVELAVTMGIDDVEVGNDDVVISPELYAPGVGVKAK